MGELGAEAQVGVQEVEQEVEGPLLDKVRDEPEHIHICSDHLSELDGGRHTYHLNCFLSVQRSRVSSAMHWPRRNSALPHTLFIMTMMGKKLFRKKIVTKLTIFSPQA